MNADELMNKCNKMTITRISNGFLIEADDIHCKIIYECEGMFTKKPELPLMAFTDRMGAKDIDEVLSIVRQCLTEKGKKPTFKE